MASVFICFSCHVPSSHQHPKNERQWICSKTHTFAHLQFLHAYAASCAISIHKYGLYTSHQAPCAERRLLSIKVWRPELLILEIHASIPTTGQKAAMRVISYNRSSPVHGLQKHLWKASLLHLHFGNNQDQPLSCSVGKTHLNWSILNLHAF